MTQKSMISADLAADGPPQMRAKVRCQSSAKHFLVEGDPEAAGCERRAVKKLGRKVRGEHGVTVCVVLALDWIESGHVAFQLLSLQQSMPGVQETTSTCASKTGRLNLVRQLGG